ncbi:MAG: phenylalanine--tRNA ligase subunit beta [Rhodospirillales bacterium]|nr:MAG: phenylalanine--tRNA ligase subunit beta [Rhodospirillales bacterium]
MKFTLSWLKDHLDTDASAADLAETLTMIGLELEALVDRTADFRDLVVADVVAARPHPDADKLQVCTVTTGTTTVEVVCGAPNARAGMKGVFAPVGARIAGTGDVLRKARIRGVESQGMLLSEREMGLSDEHTGIVELPEDATAGASAAEAMGLADPLIDIAITPNRGDCLGVRGVARDLAAAGKGSLKPLDTRAVPGAFPSPLGVTLAFDEGAADACPYFVGRTIRGIRNGESPEWLQRRLISVGLRPISAVVDITNFMTLDLCRPLHAFDADRVRGDRLTVRSARPGERLVALNGQDYALEPGMTVIADAVEPEALGGVMGGERTACTGDTTTVFLESAWFDPVRTAATGRSLGLASDARYRFERGIDPAFLVDGLEIATRLVLACCGGEASELVVAGAEPAWRRTITLDPARIAALGGVAVATEDIVRILEGLGCAVTTAADGRLGVEPPSWRGDIVGEACLVEEVLRIHGYDRVPVVPLDRDTPLPQPALNPGQRRRNLARRLLAQRGLTEVVTFSFLSRDDAARFGGGAEPLRLVNPISADLDVMRPSILPNLIAAVGRNADRGFPDGALFEVGPVYHGDRPEDQRMTAAVVRSGRTGPRHWAAAPRPVDVFDAKADALAVLAALDVATTAVTVSADAPGWFHPGRSGTLRLGPHQVLGRFGEVHPRVLRAMGVAGPVAALELDLDAVPPAKVRPGGATRPPLALSPLQPVERDFAFVVGSDVAAADVVRAVREADPLVTSVGVFDVFAGESLGPGRKSLAVTVSIQPRERTLREADLDAIAARIVDRVAARCGGTLRS